MIDAGLISRAVLEEARFWASRCSFSDAPGLTPEEKYQRYSVEAPLPSADVIARVIEATFWASMLVEEGRPCAPRLAFVPQSVAEFGAPRFCHAFETPVALNPHVLRKLFPAHGPAGNLAWDVRDDVPKIVGVQPPIRHRDDLVIVAPSPGAVDIVWHSNRIVSFRQGALYRLSENILFDAGRLLGEIGSSLGSVGTNSLSFVLPTLMALRAGDHGGAVWISNETLDAVTMGHAIASAKRPLFERFKGNIDDAARFTWLNSLASLASVDGAVILDLQLNLRGFAAFIAAGVPCQVRRQRHEGEDLVTSTTFGGGRHRSAIEFCRRYAPAVAIVVSEDGPVHIVSCIKAGSAPVYYDAAAVGYDFPGMLAK